MEVQPCFNRDIITELSDQVTTSLLELGAWAEGERVHYESSRIVDTQPRGNDDNDIDSQFLDAVTSDNLTALKDCIGRLKDSPDAGKRFTRTFLAAIVNASEESLGLLLETNLVDVHAEDEINERNCLHEAAISGRVFILQAGLLRRVDVARVDVYGRIPLHYASMHGRGEMLLSLLEAGPGTIDSMDHDNFTPLIHAIVHNQEDCMRQLLGHQARIHPISDADHIPLNIACQHGSVPIVTLLLEKQAVPLADAEGLFPQHLVARSGQAPGLMLLLRDFGADLDEVDKLNGWTPIFHAASEGHVACVQTLLDCGARIDILDEKELSAMYYAAWEGYLECMRLLTSSGLTSGLVGPSIATLAREPLAAVRGADPMAVDADGIPDLSLPPPIIPLRRYGHNFLDTKTFVQISFEESGSGAIVFYHDSKYPAARLTISSKLCDLIPRNVLLPIQDETRIVSFQIDSLESFAIDFDIFPTFGSKVIAKTVALSSIFDALEASSGHCCLPLFDPRLRAIGQISFNYQVIKPFPGTPLEITDFATYWKATSQFDFHPTALITGSSLSGEYVRLFVQLTSDMVPVLYPRWTVEHGGIDFPVGRLTHEQFLKIGAQQRPGPGVMSQLHSSDMASIHQILATSFMSLREALADLPPGIHVDLEVLYPTASQEQLQGLSPTPNLNIFADAILKEVFDHARHVRERSPNFMRSVIFSSYNLDVCTALNWKQPNCKRCRPTSDYHLLVELLISLRHRPCVPVQRSRQGRSRECINRRQGRE